MEKWRKDHLKAVSVLKELLDTAEAKLNAPVQVSFFNLRAFLQDVEVRKVITIIGLVGLWPFRNNHGIYSVVPQPFHPSTADTLLSI